MSQIMEPETSQTSSLRDVDYLELCEDSVRRMQQVIAGSTALNKRQCQDLACILSVKLLCIRMALDASGQLKVLLAGLLAMLHRQFEKAEVLVNQCAQEDWCAAAVFQYRNFVSFETILRRVNSVGSAILDCVCFKKYYTTFNKDFFSSVDQVDVDKDVGADKEELRMRLEGVEKGLAAEQVVLNEQQHLARYLLKKHKFQSEHVTLDTFTFDALKPILWEKENEPPRTWGDSKFLGAGGGASGVCKTSWLGVPCAKKEFHGEESLKIFVKEALIMAQLKHPCIVDFICCGNGEEKGDRFIAMEIMEKSLFDLIEEQKGVPFPLDVALDIIWQIVDGVCYLHDNGIAHRDLKPHNVVVKAMRSPYHENTYYCVKLVDFGISKNEVEVSKSYTMSYRGIGTARYIAPEAHPKAHPHPEGLGKVNWFKADAYSFAITCAHVLTLKQPFEEIESFNKLYMEILNGRRPSLPRECPEALVELLEECWSSDRSKRPRFDLIYDRLQGTMLKTVFTMMDSCTQM